MLLLVFPLFLSYSQARQILVPSSHRPSANLPVIVFWVTFFGGLDPYSLAFLINDFRRLLSKPIVFSFSAVSTTTSFAFSFLTTLKKFDMRPPPLAFFSSLLAGMVGRNKRQQQQETQTPLSLSVDKNTDTCVL